MQNKKILIFGAEGQLGSEFKKHLDNHDYTFLAPKENDCNITDYQQIKEIFKSFKPAITINCAAYNAVNEAEEDKETAFNINHYAVKSLAELTDSFGSKLVHYSTDYVFDGTKQDIYTENDPTNPLNIYGKSKLEGEVTVLGHNNSFLVFRLSWVIGRGSQNFLFKFSGWAKNQKVLKVSADEVSVPTFTSNVVSLTLRSIEKDLCGLYHMTNSGYASRYELARYFAEKKQMKNLIIPVAMSEFKSPVKRPLFTAMSNGKLSSDLNMEIPDWKTGLDEFLSNS